MYRFNTSFMTSIKGQLADYFISFTTDIEKQKITTQFLCLSAMRIRIDINIGYSQR